MILFSYCDSLSKLRETHVYFFSEDGSEKEKKNILTDHFSNEGEVKAMAQ